MTKYWVPFGVKKSVVSVWCSLGVTWIASHLPFFSSFLKRWLVKSEITDWKEECHRRKTIPRFRFLLSFSYRNSEIDCNPNFMQSFSENIVYRENFLAIWIIKQSLSLEPSSYPGDNYSEKTTPRRWEKEWNSCFRVSFWGSELVSML